MPKITSIHWDEKTGVCEKHCLPMLPCPICLAQQDKDVEVRLSEIDLLELDFEVLSPENERLGVGGFFATEEQWLIKRIRR